MTAILDSASPAAVAGDTRRFMREGARDITPMVIGVIPFGLAIGAAVTTSSLSTAQGVASAPVILAGAAQLSTVQMIDAGVAPAMIVLSALLINARILLYSASIAPWFRGESMRRRLLLAVPVIDQMHFTCVPRFERGDLDARQRRAYYAGAATWLLAAWIGSQAVAITVGATLPDSVGLHVAAPLALAGLLAKSIATPAAATAAGCAVLVVTIGTGLPFHSAVLAATLAGITVGTLLARTRS